MVENSILSVAGCLAALVFLSGCSETVKELEITATPTEKPSLVLPQADELNLRDVKWLVITRDNFDEKIKELENSSASVVFFAVSAEGYENLSLNLNDLRTYIEQQKQIIAAYDSYYKQ